MVRFCKRPLDFSRGLFAYASNQSYNYNAVLEHLLIVVPILMLGVLFTSSEVRTWFRDHGTFASLIFALACSASRGVQFNDFLWPSGCERPAQPISSRLFGFEYLSMWPYQAIAHYMRAPDQIPPGVWLITLFLIYFTVFRLLSRLYVSTPNSVLIFRPTNKPSFPA